MASDNIRIVVHRDRTFTWAGWQFYISYQGPGWGWEVRLSDLYGPAVATYHSLRELRDKFPHDFEDYECQRHLPGSPTREREQAMFRSWVADDQGRAL